MKRKMFFFMMLALILLVGVVFSGCQEKTNKTNEIAKNVFLESDILEFAYVNFTKSINKTGDIEKVTVEWLFHNIAGRTINATIIVEFYDKEDNLLYTEQREIYTMPADWTEHLLEDSNRVSYDGEYVADVDHVIIRTVEI